MKTLDHTTARRVARGFTSLALLCVLSIALLPAPSAIAAEKAEHAPALPLTATFEKVKTDQAPPFVLKLKNTSKNPVEVSATILLSVQSHNRDKARKVPAHKIAAGDTWTIDGLAALDKVTVEGKGFAPLELEVK